ncbi:hypothetical protein GOP47_0021840 [Adiantum capillus-veneris]|uniref:Uncharacterized protein n=1 Tax=Adiantum capillus-veneris TaxID=13818 RepID=A0A9D4Z5L7_ADICA|nr:hypothetical protein GOP47_0021840 [Adiantum capillus-veneris]
MKEIISIQVGGYANFVGSHFWNLQDELLGLQNDDERNSCFSNCGVNFDVLYRTGETRQGLPTYTPRLLAIDARGSLGTVKATGSLYEQPVSLDAASVRSWEGKVSIHVSEPHIKNEFLQSLEQEDLEWNVQEQGNVSGSSTVKSGSRESRDEHKILQHLVDTVQFWTDYSKVQFHPLSLFQLEGVWHEATPFDNYGSGKGIFSGFTEEEALDRLRFFVEEADHMQGLQMLVDDSNGFATVASEFLEAVNDEYGKSPVFLFMVRPPSSLGKPMSVYEATVRDFHDAISFSALNRSSSHVVPLGLSSFAEMSRYLHVVDGKNFHTGAVYAAAISCMSLPLRMNVSEGRVIASQKVYGGMDMRSLVQVLSGPMGRQVSTSELAMPAPTIPGTDKLEALESSRFRSLLQGVIKTEDQAASEAVVVQGASSLDASVPASLQDVVNFFGRKDKLFYHLSASVCPLAVPLPFPSLLSSSGGRSSDVTSMSIATKLSTSVSVLPYIEKRLLSLRQPRGSLGRQILEGWGLQKDDVQEFCESISNVVGAYRNIMAESASDSE